MPVGVYKHHPQQGFQKGYTPWCKGTRGLVKPNSGSFRKGHKRGMTGKHHTDEWRRKQALAANKDLKTLELCLFCGKEFLSWKHSKRQYCSVKCKTLHSRETQKGSKSHLWKGGKTELSKLVRTRVKYKEWRRVVFQRDKYVCQKCNIVSGNGKAIYLHAHHKKSFSKFPKLRYRVSNGITLCKDCHLSSHLHKF